MRRLSLAELKTKQVELERKIAEAEKREQLNIGIYMQSLTGKCELDGVKKWLEENAILDSKGDVK